MDPSVLVTGASGFVGRWVVSHLVASKHRVIALVHRAPQVDNLARDAVAVRGDITDFKLVMKTLETYRVDAIVHCAAVVGRSESDLDPVRAVTVNVGGSANVLEAARRANIRRLVYVSSGSAYGVERRVPSLRESQRTVIPSDLYGFTKFVGEWLMTNYREAHGMSTVVVRLSRVYGQGRNMAATLPLDILLGEALAGGPLRLTPAMRTRIDYTYVKDAATAIQLILDAVTLPHTLYNVSGGEPANGRMVADALRQILPALEVTETHGPDSRPFPYDRAPFDVERIRDDLGFVPRFDLVAGLRDYIAETGSAAVTQ